MLKVCHLTFVNEILCGEPEQCTWGEVPGRANGLTSHTSPPITKRAESNKAGGSRDRVHYSGGYHVANTKEAQRNRQQYGLDIINSSGLELIESSSSAAPHYSMPPFHVHLWLAFSLTLTSRRLVALLARPAGETLQW